MSEDSLNLTVHNQFHPKHIKVALGNERVRYNSYVDGLRRKVYINSM